MTGSMAASVAAGAAVPVGVGGGAHPELRAFARQALSVSSLRLQAPDPDVARLAAGGGTALELLVLVARLLVEPVLKLLDLDLAVLRLVDAVEDGAQILVRDGLTLESFSILLGLRG